jgi:nucleoprotein TPR
MSAQDKFQSRISGMMKTKAADAEKQAAAITEAVEKAKADMSNSVDPAAQETIQKRHAEELRSLERKLTSKHEAELKTRVENAVAEALKAKPTTDADTDQKAAIEAAIADYEKQAQARRAEETALIEARHAEDIASAVDRGRMEQAAKGKLKDSQLVKAQKRVKELEASILEWEAQGIKLPQISSTTAATAPGPSAASPVQTAAKPPPLTASTSGAGPSQPKPTPTAPAAANAGTLPPRRSAPTGPAGTGPTGPGRGGAVRGLGRNIHMASRGGALRTAPVKPSAPSPASDTPPVGVSIMGAAAKRPREEGSSEDQSLAKRIKAVEPTNRRPNAPAE